MNSAVTLTARAATLTKNESLSLARCEAEMTAAVEDMRSAWKRFGAAIGRVHDHNLWRERYGSFDAYLDEYVYARWRIARRTAYEWMQAAGVVLNIESHAAAYAVVIEPPTRASHAQELARLPGDEQAPALIEAREMAATNGRTEPTRYEFERVVTARLGEPTPRSPQQTAHEREQRALKQHLLRIWIRLDDQVKRDLLRELPQLLTQEYEDKD